MAVCVPTRRRRVGRLHLRESIARRPQLLSRSLARPGTPAPGPPRRAPGQVGWVAGPMQVGAPYMLSPSVRLVQKLPAIACSAAAPTSLSSAQFRDGWWLRGPGADHLKLSGTWDRACFELRRGCGVGSVHQTAGARRKSSPSNLM